MNPSGPNPAASKFSGLALLLVKLSTCFITGSTACAIWFGPIGTIFNPFTALFCVALICLVPLIRWTAPAIIFGFCVGPTLFAPAINGSGAQDINGAIIGAVLGIVAGLSMDFVFGKPNRIANSR